jgi:hypothetical protein
VLDLLALGRDHQLLPRVDEVGMLDLLVEVVDGPPAGQLRRLGDLAQAVAALDRVLLAVRLVALGDRDDLGRAALHGVDGIGPRRQRER